MASLFNTRISDTYSGLIKTIDNAAITASLKEITDGNGTGTGLFVNNAGDFKVTAILEFGSLKDTGENITITKFVDEADGIANNDNDTSIPTTAAIVDYVSAQITIEDLDFTGDTGSGQIDLDSQIFAIGGTTNEITTVASGQSLTLSLDSTGVNLPDNSTAITQTAGDSSTKIANTKFVMDLDSASDLDFSGDSGTGDVNLNTQTLAVTGTANQIESTASGQGLSLQFPTAGVTLPNGSVATTQSAGDSSTKIATTEFVTSLDAASDLDITDGTNVGDINLNTQSLSILGTTNEIDSVVSGQSVTLGLPSSISTNLVGDVTGNLTGNVVGDLTGNADSATKWQTARDLSLTGQATGTISSVDGTGNVSGAVTLDNNSVTAKVLTGLTSPSSSSVLATDTILEGFGKVQSQINGLAGGLRFMGDWNATTNSPVLSSGGGEAANGTTTSTTANKLVDSSASFTSTVTVGDQVVNQVDGQTALVSNVDSDTTLSLSADIMVTGEAYTIDNSPFITQGHYYVVSVGGTTSLNGISNWSVGDWVIAGANNQWTKLDHSQVDGTGTTGNLTKWASTSVIADSIVSESGTAITVDGSLATNSFLSSTGNFSVNTDKFTVAASSGDTAFTGDLAINTDKFTVNATSGNTAIAGDVSMAKLTATKSGTAAVFNSGTTNVVASFTSTDGTGVIQLADSGGNVEIGAAGNDFVVQPAGGVTQLTVGSSSSTFAGDVIQSSASKSLKYWRRLWTDANNDWGLNNNAGSAVISVSGMGTPSTSTTTFAGTILAGGGGAYLHLNPVITASSNANEPKSIVVNNQFNGSSAEAKFIVATYGNSWHIGMGSSTHTYGNDLTFTTDATTSNSPKLRIATNGNATFAGDVTIANGKFLKLVRNSGSLATDAIGITSGSDDVRLLTTGDFNFVNGSLTNLLNISNSGNSTFAGDLIIHNTSNAPFIDFVESGATSDSKARITMDQVDTDNGQLIFSTEGAGTLTERMRIDSSGNVSIGTVTPLYLVGTSDVAQISVNRVGTTGAITNTSRSAAYINLNGADGGSSIEFNTASGNNTQPSEKMRIDSNGVIQLPQSGNNGYINYNSTDLELDVNRNPETGTFSDANKSHARISISGANGGSNISFKTANANNTVATERMRITSDGNFGFNETTITNPYSQTNFTDLNIDGTWGGVISFKLGGTEKGWIGQRSSGNADMALGASSGQNLLFYTNGVNERMRIDSSGYLRLNNTDAGNYLFKIKFNGQSQEGIGVQSSFADGGNILRVLNSSGTGIGGITSSNTNTTFNTSSDYRLKEDLKDFAGLDMVSKIPVYDFKWKSDESRSYGVMAHELEEVLPQAVCGEKDAEEMQSVDYSKIVPLLVKSIQELTAEVDKLKQECKCK